MLRKHGSDFYFNTGIFILFLTVFFVQPSKAQEEFQSEKYLHEIIVEEDRITEFENKQVRLDQLIRSSPDAGSLVKKAPGADLASNGPISGQIQYRGMRGQRMNVSLNGHTVKPGGPNWMDPPLHYLPLPLVQEIDMERGITGVSDGIMTMGGSAKASIKKSEFKATRDYQFTGEASGIGRTVNEGISMGGIVSYANRNRRFHVMGSSDRGSNRHFPEGTIEATEYDREVSGFGFGIREHGDTYSFDFRHTDTNKSGNPSLPMDIQFFNTDQIEAKYSTQWAGNPLVIHVNSNDVDHKMNNFSLRPVPDFNTGMNPGPAFDGQDRRFILAESNDLGFHLNRKIPFKEGSLRWGLDYTEHDHNATVFDPDSMFFVESFDDITDDKISGFLEWSGPYTEDWDLETGLRITRVDMTAGQAQADTTIPSGGATPPPLESLRTAFNSSSRSEDDINLDGFLTLSRSLNENFTFDVGFSRKVRSPSYIERFAWVPIEATAGLADGNIHVGNQNLDPEIAHKLEIGFEWTGKDAYLTPRFFYRDIDDYIQGTPAGINPTQRTVSTVNGDPSPLKYNNVEAEIDGFDASWGHDLPQFDKVRVDGTISFLSGQRGDTDDDLYRFTPSRTSVRLQYELQDLLLGVQGKFSREQQDVSETNSEPPTAGYGIMNLTTRWPVNENTRFNFSVNNVFDKTYRRHLSGFNRVRGSDVPTGRRAEARLPGNERNFVVTLKHNW